MIASAFPYISALQLRLKAKQCIIDEFKSGERYTKVQEAHEKEIRYLERKLKKSRLETAKAHAETISVRKAWMSIVDDCIKEADIMGKQLFELAKENLKPCAGRILGPCQISPYRQDDRKAACKSSFGYRGDRIPNAGIQKSRNRAACACSLSGRRGV